MGRRLAFDGAKGRLWVVCSKCGRWNLTPLEERWEAIEECEKQYRATLTRSSTDQIGLGRVKEGTDLIRIGEPLRPEFAAWRYGRHFQRRRRQTQLTFGGGIVLYAAAAAIGGPMTLLPGVAGILYGIANKKSEIGRARNFIKQRAETGLARKIRRAEDVNLRIISTNDDQGWGLRFAHEGNFLDFHGGEAVHTAHLIAPAINVTGCKPSDVKEAVDEIERVGSPDRYFSRVLKFTKDHDWQWTALQEYPAHMRLAFEMAAHEETERAAIEGELMQLENDWREAEEIAGIADNLFLPQSVTDFIDRHRPNGKA